MTITKLILSTRSLFYLTNLNWPLKEAGYNHTQYWGVEHISFLPCSSCQITLQQTQLHCWAAWPSWETLNGLRPNPVGRNRTEYYPFKHRHRSFKSTCVGCPFMDMNEAICPLTPQRGTRQTTMTPWARHSVRDKRKARLEQKGSKRTLFIHNYTFALSEAISWNILKKRL